MATLGGTEASVDGGVGDDGGRVARLPWGNLATGTGEFRSQVAFFGPGSELGPGLWMVGPRNGVGAIRLRR
jgi:hypothetical protein